MGGDSNPDGRQSPSRMVDSMNSEWTNEKHSSYLNSIEASFVNQLYASDHHTNDLHGRWLKAPKHSNLPGSRNNTMSSGQFKVQRGGCWEKLNFERARSRAEIENESRLLSANPWIQHFKSPSASKDLVSTSSNQDNNGELANSLQHSGHGRKTVEATQSKLLSVRSSNKYCKDSVGSNREMSGQNFVNEEIEVKKSSRKLQKKKAKTKDSSEVNDQVVPTRNVLRASMEGKDAECNGRKSKSLAASVQHEHELPLFNEQEFDSVDSNAT